MHDNDLTTCLRPAYFLSFCLKDTASPLCECPWLELGSREGSSVQMPSIC